MTTEVPFLDREGKRIGVATVSEDLRTVVIILESKYVHELHLPPDGGLSIGYAFKPAEKAL